MTSDQGSTLSVFPIRETIAGLLSLGAYPQQHLPQLNVTMVVYPSVTGEPVDGIDVLDSRSIDGAIPVVLQEALRLLRATLQTRAVFVDGQRIKSAELPGEALREAVANAIVHRDLAPGARARRSRSRCIPIG